MKTFNEFWELLSPKVEYANRRRACYDLWNKLPENRQDALYETISDKLSKGKFVDYNPLFAMKNNSQPKQMQMSYADYYARYGTTEEKDGWHMENPTGNKVIYVKEPFSGECRKMLP